MKLNRRRVAIHGRFTAYYEGTKGVIEADDGVRIVCSRGVDPGWVAEAMANKESAQKANTYTFLQD